jgi:hypothetical protein
MHEHTDADRGQAHGAELDLSQVDIALPEIPSLRARITQSTLAQLSALMLTATTGCHSVKLSVPEADTARPLYPEVAQMNLRERHNLEERASTSPEVTLIPFRGIILPGQSLREMPFENFKVLVSRFTNKIRAENPGAPIEVQELAKGSALKNLILSDPAESTSVYIVDRRAKSNSNELQVKQISYRSGELSLRPGAYQSQYIIPHREPSATTANRFRVFASDGAFSQKQRLSATSWLNGLSHELEKSVDGLNIDVFCLEYAERQGIRESANGFCRKIIEQIQKSPLAEDEDIALFGHSQGAYILCYMLKRHEEDKDYFPEFPWEKVCGLITVDLPFNTVEGYDGKLEPLLRFLEGWNTVDPVLLPLIIEAIYPAGHDYVSDSKTLEYIKEPATLEMRNMRIHQNGDPVYIGKPGWEIDHPSSQWNHHPFMEYSRYRQADRDLRTELIVQYVRMLGLYQRLEHHGVAP